MESIDLEMGLPKKCAGCPYGEALLGIIVESEDLHSQIIDVTADLAQLSLNRDINMEIPPLVDRQLTKATMRTQAAGNLLLGLLDNCPGRADQLACQSPNNGVSLVAQHILENRQQPDHTRPSAFC